MSALQPTPETDAFLESLHDDLDVELAKVTQWAKQMEHSRNEAREKYAREKQALNNAAQDCFRLIRENDGLRHERDSAKTLNRSLLDQLEAQAVQIEALRKERDELRDEIVAANSSSEMELVQETQAQNVQLLEQVSRLLHEKASLIDAIKQAHEALEVSSRSLHGHSYYKAQSALAELKTFIKP